jgi:hypothetical protein
MAPSENEGIHEGPPAFLQVFFAGDRGRRVVVHFELNKPRDIVFSGKSGDSLGSVLVNPTNDVIGNPDMDCAIFSACQYINVVAHDFDR